MPYVYCTTQLAIGKIIINFCVVYWLTVEKSGSLNVTKFVFSDYHYDHQNHLPVVNGLKGKFVCPLFVPIVSSSLSDDFRGRPFNS